MEKHLQAIFSSRASTIQRVTSQFFVVMFFLCSFFQTAPCNAAPINVPFAAQEIHDRVLSEVAPGIDLARASKTDSYVLWPQRVRLTYKIVSSQLFFYGIFYTYLSSLSNATDVDFRLIGDIGIQPNVLVVMDYNIDSWDQVSRFLESREETGFEDKLGRAREGRFTGCTVDLHYKDGVTQDALIVINIRHAASDVRKCLYKTAFQLFGLYPENGDSPMGLDLLGICFVPLKR